MTAERIEVQEHDHCWHEGPVWDERTDYYCPDCDGQHGTTCMLQEGHKPPHIYTPDCQIRVRFSDLGIEPE